jgi:hypothetical protein
MRSFTFSNWHLNCSITLTMQELHVATIRFLNPLLKCKERQVAKAAHPEEFATLTAEFENLKNRLCLEIVYALEAGERDHRS